MEKTDILLVSKPALLEGLDKALANYKVAALTNKEQRVLYDYIDSSGDIVFDYLPTVLSPKKFFFPQEEVIVEFTNDGKVAPKIEAKPLILFGVRPCDLNAIKIMDEAFSSAYGDPNYLARREQSVIIGMDCKSRCDENAFCSKVSAHEARGGYDMIMYDLGDKFVLKVTNDKGAKFVQEYLATTTGSETAIEAFAKEKQAAFAKDKPFRDLDKLPDVYQANKNHPVWEKEGKKCLSCGSCIMVCPTCYCFDVVDELALSLKKGERLRRWDACMLSSFAEVAGGENFRKKTTARLHHRISRKFDYLMRKHKQPVCVGCGRCVRACLAKINPSKITAEIVGE